MMLYLRMIACWLEHTRLFIEVYKNNTRRVKMSVSSPPKEEAQEEKKRKNRLKRAECEKRDPSLYTANRSSLRLRNRMETISTRIFSLRTPFAQIRRAFGSSSRRHPRSSWGLGSRTEEKKGTKQREKNLSRLIRKQNIAHVPSSTAFGVIFRVRPPHVCKAHFYV
jgi:hypothetical protein